MTHAIASSRHDIAGEFLNDPTAGPGEVQDTLSVQSFKSRNSIDPIEQVEVPTLKLNDSVASSFSDGQDRNDARLEIAAQSPGTVGPDK